MKRGRRRRIENYVATDHFASHPTFQQTESTCEYDTASRMRQQAGDDDEMSNQWWLVVGVVLWCSAQRGLSYFNGYQATPLKSAHSLNGCLNKDMGGERREEAIQDSLLLSVWVVGEIDGGLNEYIFYDADKYISMKLLGTNKVRRRRRRKGREKIITFRGRMCVIACPYAPRPPGPCLHQYSSLPPIVYTLTMQPHERDTGIASGETFKSTHS